VIVEAAAAACELGISLATVVADLVALVLVASARPWRYALSPTFRSAEEGRLRNRGVFFKAFYFGWGSIALLASIGLIVGAIWAVSNWHAQQTLREEKQRATVKAVKEKAFELKERLGK
jgi:hypothetical protein